MKKFLFSIIIWIVALSGVWPCLADTAAGREDAGFWGQVRNFFLPHSEERRILLQRHTPYFLVTVEEDNGGLRHLVFNPRRGSQGIWNPQQPDTIYSSYCRYTVLTTLLLEAPPERVLFIGLGAGITPRMIRRQFPATIMDIVEIDPEIPGIAGAYFGFVKDDKMNLIIGDGRDYLNRNRKKYDLIFIDAYNAEAIPFQLTTLEFYRRVRSALLPGGMMNVNVANLNNPHFIASELKTVRTVFPGMQVFISPGNANYILFAGQGTNLDFVEINEEQFAVAEKVVSGIEIKQMLETGMPVDELDNLLEDATVLTDDFAPVEVMK